MTRVAARKGQGRKPKPEAQKRLSGSRRANNDAVEFSAVVNIDCPAWLTGLAAEMWETVCPQLCKSGVLSANDAHLLEAFATEYQRWRNALDIYNDPENGGPVVIGANGGPIKNPAGTVINECLRNITSYGAQLGLSPSARSALISPGGKPSKGEFEEF